MLFDKQNIAYDFDYYRKYEAPKTFQRKYNTLVYNLFGVYTDMNSMVLTFDDLFDYMLNIMGDNEINIKSDLRNYNAVLFFGFQFDKWYFKLLLRLMQFQNDKLLHSHDIDICEAKNFYADEFQVEFVPFSAEKIIFELHNYFAVNKMLQAKRQIAKVDSSEIFVSYAWGGQSEEFVNQLDTQLQKNNILLVRDKRDLAFKGLITEFMQRIGKGKGIVLVVSDKYLKSPYCMFELMEIYRNLEFRERIFPIVLSDANIYEPIARLGYLKYWRDKKNELDTAIQDFGTDAITVIGDDYKTYKKIFDNFGEISNILKDINSLTPDIHQSSNFEQLIEEIRKKL